jgi:prepilin-type N-terminal cleavage/methylation domain-containing protein
MRRLSLSHEHGYTLVEILVALAVVAILAAAAVPMTASSLTAYRFQGDGQALSRTVSLAKMRAAAGFTHARLYVDLSDNTYRVETFNRTDETWVAEGGTQFLSRDVTFSDGGIDNPPPNQASMATSSPCTDDDDADIANTACVVFNSRGLPIDHVTRALDSTNAIYITNGIGVYGATVMSSGQVRFFWTPVGGGTWVEQQ